MDFSLSTFMTHWMTKCHLICTLVDVRVSGSSTSCQQTPDSCVSRSSSPIVQTPAVETPRAEKKSRPNGSTSELAEMVDVLKRLTNVSNQNMSAWCGLN